MIFLKTYRRHILVESKKHQERTTLIRRRIDVMVGSPSKKSWRTWNICGFLENCSWWHTWLSPTQHEQSSPQNHQFDQKTSLLKCKFVIGTRMKTRLGNRLGGDFTGREKGWRCSLDRISKVYLDRHQKSKLKIKFHLLFKQFPSSKI